ncbi:hypothetical protein BJY01DRAFT_254073 [Aspergillus pseudoustus]|uniref:F-box domain-containing protein n=1 Tax=Aspergillus pseudoustus TaxID=1810923 RepID=A0ABR4IVZ7_9EURO
MSLHDMPNLIYGNFSAIEKLPGEILRDILIFSHEWNLVRASKAIEEKTVGESVYQIFLFQAFWAYPGGWIKQPPPHILPYWYQPLSAKEQRRLQVSIIHTTWFNADRLSSMMPVFYNATLQVALGHTVNIPSERKTLAVSDIDALTDDETYLNLNLHRVPKVLMYDIPRPILFKPWDKDKLKLLITIYRNLYYSTLVREVTRPLLPPRIYFEAMHEALMEQKLRAFIYILLTFKITETRHRYISPEPVLPASLFRVALNQNLSDGRYLTVLLLISPRSLPDDTLFYSWALRRGAHDAAGLRVLQTMRSNQKQCLSILLQRSVKLLLRRFMSWRDDVRYQDLVQQFLT